MTVGEKVRQLREQNNITQQELAEVCGFQKATSISNIEKGNRKIPFPVIVKLSNYFGVSPNYLLGFTESSVDLQKLRKMGFTSENLSKLDSKDCAKLEAYLQALLDTKR